MSRRLTDSLPAFGLGMGALAAHTWGLGVRWVALFGAFAVVWLVLVVGGARARS